MQKNHIAACEILLAGMCDKTIDLQNFSAMCRTGAAVQKRS